LTDTGALWAWGSNSQGQFGNGTTTASNVPVEILSISGVIAVAAGGTSTYALKSNGTVWAWGYNADGQLGDGTTTSSTSPVAVSSLTNVVAIAAGISHGLALKSDGTVWAWGANSAGQIGDGTTTARSTPVQVTSLSTNALAIAAGGESSAAVKVDGTAWGWAPTATGRLVTGRRPILAPRRYRRRR
jgi:alpha-tubulin suppressor-like RCC1 family protein